MVVLKGAAAMASFHAKAVLGLAFADLTHGRSRLIIALASANPTVNPSWSQATRGA
jgi:hypothetical protein